MHDLYINRIEIFKCVDMYTLAFELWILLDRNENHPCKIRTIFSSRDLAKKLELIEVNLIQKQATTAYKYANTSAYKHFAWFLDMYSQELWAKFMEIL